MHIAAHAVGDSSIRIWGLPSRTRLERQLASIAGEVRWLDTPSAAAEDETVLLIRADHLFEVRGLRALVERPGCVLRCPDDGALVAAHVPGPRATEAAELLRGERTAVPDDLDLLDPVDLGRYDAQLRRAEPPMVAAIRPDNREQLEALLYGNAYKGITDLVTKWLWPRPARHVVRACAHLDITPNAVTGVGAALVILAGWAFVEGHYALGLVAGWLMTFLDTVDGKLARVTVRASPFGHYLDHGIDLIHPPFWYLFWGMGLASFDPVLGLDRGDLYWIIVVGYVGGRLAEGLFHLLGDCSIFTWRPFDSYFRLVTARRNPCLIILTVAALVGAPGAGLVGVAAWTGVTTLVLAVRLLLGTVARLRAAC
ncbi:MAG: CDP-alcohol phosphatidyltransferase family protein [Gammaproteobacteria bacterium]|nr:CDP-alcohol phosphatidyltransferase family protein [Gammaproteobacteria bacterium]